MTPTRQSGLLLAGPAFVAAAGPGAVAQSGLVPFTIANGKMQPTASYVARVSVLGAKLISSNQGYPYRVGVRVHIGGQPSVADFVAPSVDKTVTPYRMNLGPNQVIFAIELGNKPVSSPRPDDQDLVVLVTVAESLLALDASGFATD